MGEISNAIERNEDRKSAALGRQFDEAPIGLDSEGEEQLRLILNGLDLDPDELMQESGTAAQVGAAAMLTSSSHPALVLKGLWVDGLITGMLLMKARDDNGTP